MWKPPLPARAVLSLGILATVWGCGVAPAPGNPYGPVATQLPTEVEVYNGRFEDLTVYLVRNGSLNRLGVVPGKSARVLVIPRHHAVCTEWISLAAAHPDRKLHAESAEFLIQEGERAHWNIELYSGPSPVIY